MNTLKKVCVVTGTRAEYGILFNTLKELKKSNKIKLQIIASGTHLEKSYGLTYKLIQNDGFIINEKVKIIKNHKKDSDFEIAKITSFAVHKFALAFNKLKPDTILVVGDRYEILAAAVAATMLKIPIAHIHGGEATEGLIDEAIRHSVTKMSHLHFVSTKIYKNRVKQMGENPKSIFNVGAPGLENIKKVKLLNKDECEKILGFNFKKKNILVTFHPVTLEKNSSKKYFSKILSALNQLKDTMIIFTKSNADSDNQIINKLIDKFVRENNNSVSYKSLGTIKYLSVLKIVDILIGNSSSGIIEAPSCGAMTINLGDRQKGRVKSKSVLDCRIEEKDILEKIKICLKMKKKRIKNLYYKKNSSQNIVKVIENTNFERILKKKFFDYKI
tara:strand:+ start:2342 stop:3502 length:1161 start_codon:yes stop_codon:yes gene_type:complete